MGKIKAVISFFAAHWGWLSGLILAIAQYMGKSHLPAPWGYIISLAITLAHLSPSPLNK